MRECASRTVALPRAGERAPEALRAYHKAELDKRLPIIKATAVTAE